MKRPLGTVALLLALLLAVGLGVLTSSGDGFGAGEKEGFRPEEGEVCIAAGKVKEVELRTLGGRSQVWITLGSVVFFRTSGLEVFSGDLLCKLEGEERPPIDSLLKVRGRFSSFSRARNPGEFDAARYYAALGIGGSLEKAVILARGEKYSRLGEGMYLLRVFWKEKLYRCFPEKEASILTTMLLGDKTGLDPEIKDLYQRNGIVHILSISGLHITLIGMGLYRLLRRAGCPVWLAALLGGLTLTGYGLLTGLGISACRAIGMYLLRMLGEILGRTYDMLTALGAVGMVMLLRRPQLLWHSGFLLSFGSICGIGLLLPAMLRVLTPSSEAVRKNFRQKLWEKFLQAFLPGLSIALFTLPVQLMFFYEIPMYSQILNLLVLPAMGIVMAAGLAAMLLPGPGLLIKLLAGADILILGCYEKLCRGFEGLPGHTWTPGAPKLWQVILYYVLLGGFLLCSGRLGEGRKNCEKGDRQRFPEISGGRCGRRAFHILLLPAAFLILSLRFHGRLEVAFLDVGQGDCICVRTGAGEVYLFDGGSSSEQKVGTYTLMPYLKSQGFTRVDGIFLSHPDGDHCSGLLELLEQGHEEGFTVERLFLPAIDLEKRGEDFGAVLEAVRRSSQPEPIQVGYLSRGDAWKSGDVTFTCLHPEENSALEDANAYSQCFLVEYGEFTMLLTGDVEGEGEEELYRALAEREPEPLTLLKVAHHGSRNSTPDKLLDLLSPKYAVISCGEDNSYGHPHEELLERLEKAHCSIYVTAESGGLILRISPRRIQKLFGGSFWTSPPKSVKIEEIRRRIAGPGEGGPFFCSESTKISKTAVSNRCICYMGKSDICADSTGIA